MFLWKTLKTLAYQFSKSDETIPQLATDFLTLYEGTCVQINSKLPILPMRHVSITNFAGLGAIKFRRVLRFFLQEQFLISGHAMHLAGLLKCSGI